MVSAARRRVVYRALKSAILRSIEAEGADMEYWIVKVSEQFDSGVLTDAMMEELITLGEPYLPEVEMPEMLEDTPAEETVEPVTEPETPVETPLETYEESDTSW